MNMNWHGVILINVALVIVSWWCGVWKRELNWMHRWIDRWIDGWIGSACRLPPTQ